MTMTMVPRRWYSWDFTVMSGDRTVASLDFSSWRERAEIVIGDVTYHVFREGVCSGDFKLERAGNELARASKPSAFRHTLIVHYNGRDYTLRKESLWRRTFVLMDGERAIGVISPESPWTRRSKTDLPAEWPAPVKAFVIWLVIMLWKRDASRS
jgi:hypothetical protein